MAIVGKELVVCNLNSFKICGASTAKLKLTLDVPTAQQIQVPRFMIVCSIVNNFIIMVVK